ncbi:MAG: cyclophilin-like fold protein [Spirosomataceae bacterium]
MNNKINVKVGNKTFTATLLDNPTSRAFVAQLPLSINMIELNNNEKYAQLPKSVPTNASVPSRIEAGDLMMYGSSTLVLFYKSFSTSYSYTKIGKIDDVSGLNTALGAGDVKVSFEVK